MYGATVLVGIIGGGNAIIQQRRYKKALKNREKNYKHTLEQERRQIANLIQKQRTILVGEYPTVKSLMNIALAKGAKPRLWWRRPDNSDFLSARVGISKGKPSFSIKLPQSINQDDPLKDLPQSVIHEFNTVPDLPFLIDLKEVGSLGIGGREPSAVYEVTRRLLLDIMIHHSPGDVQIAVLSDTGDGSKYWEWLKWTPHTQALQQGQQIHRLAFNLSSIKEYLFWLADETKKRRQGDARNFQVGIDFPAIITVIDDQGKLRQSRDIVSSLRSCAEYGIYFVFVGDHNLPNIGARLDVSDQGAFRYAETWEGGTSHRGRYERVEISECSIVSRALSQISLLGDTANVNLPSSVRLSNVLETTTFTENLIQKNWGLVQTPRELLQFPIGVKTGREGLEQTIVNLLPSKFKGDDAYHSILIGTTGSGKSEFMKSLVLGAAYKYSPEILNFFFLDFKGGAAFDVFKKLPHVVGVVTNLRPELVWRGLDAIQSEIARRQEQFAAVSVTNIWDFNTRNTQPMPHLLLLLDEFAAGLDQFPPLADILDLLVRQGRSLGMYLLLANQDVNSTVEKLLANIGWRIALKVAQSDEMSIIDKSLPVAKRAGQGYLRSLSGDVVEFQGAYAGFPIVSPTSESADDFKIYKIQGDGTRKDVYDHADLRNQSAKIDLSAPTEESISIRLMEQLAQSRGIESRPIYLDPLAEEFDLFDVIGDVKPFRNFSADGWTDVVDPNKRLVIPVGYYDLPQKCLQKVLEIDFNDQDGNLWVVGSPGSGVAVSLKTVIESLAITHTPDEVAFYMLEFGSGGLLKYSDLPHTGAVIRATERERMDRLFKFLDDEMDYRTSIGHSRTMAEQPNSKGPRHVAPDVDIFLVINNFNELKTINFEWIDSHITRYVQSGKSSKIHVITTSSRGSDLHRKVSSNIARRLVLEMATRDEYMDITGHKVAPLGISAEGRGYWVDREIGIAECQIARTGYIVFSAEETSMVSKEIAPYLKERWKGDLHPPIDTIPDCVALDELCAKQPPQVDEHTLRLPIGLSYETLEVIAPNLLEELPHWLILGPKRSGKTNFLACTIQSLLTADADWKIKLFTLRPRSPLRKQFTGQDSVQIYDAEDTVDELKNIISHLTSQDGSDVKTFILVDDIGAAFSRGNEQIKAEFDDLALKLGSSPNVYLFVTGLPDELRVGPALADDFIKLLKQSNTGVVFSKDTMILDWFGVPGTVVRPYRTLEFDAGRGFYISVGKAQVIQTACIDGESA